jgi:hypothetical protein
MILLIPVVCWGVIGGLPVPPRSADAAEPAAMPADLASLIVRVRENEALFRNLSATIQITSEDWKNGASGTLPESFPEVDETPRHPTTIRKARIVSDGEEFHFTNEESISIGAGLIFTRKQIARFDGAETVFVDDGICTTIFRGRYEPGRMLPPHCWGFFREEINVPLSVYLGGTTALRSHSRARRFPVENWVSGIERTEAGRVRVQFLGAEMVGDLQCVKVQVERWHNETHATRRPELEFLWLAKDRNFHVARYQTDLKGLTPGQWAWVTKWRSVAEGVWLPAVIKFETRGNTRCWTTTEALLNRDGKPADIATSPAPLPEVPRLVIAGDGHLEQPPPVRKNAASGPAVTLSSILVRLAEEEAKYDRLDVTAVRSHDLVSLPAIASAGRSPLRRTTRTRSVVAGEKWLVRGEQISRRVGGSGVKESFHTVWNGQWARFLDDFTGMQSARVAMNRPAESHIPRPHTLVCDSAGSMRSLSQFLKYGRLDDEQMVVSYSGDERIGEIVCHKLKCELPAGRRRFFLWLARDRNLLAIRREAYAPGWSNGFPNTLASAGDLREISPGVWFPWRTTHLQFAFSRSAARPLVNEREEIRVESVAFKPDLDESLFDTLSVPAGIPVEIHDRDGTSLAIFPQPRTGNIEVTPGKLDEWRKKRHAKSAR